MITQKLRDSLRYKKLTKTQWRKVNKAFSKMDENKRYRAIIGFVDVDNIDNAFLWILTDEGHIFWGKIYTTEKTGEDNGK